MSHPLIQHYLNELSDLKRVSGTVRELVVREAFKTLLKDWGKSRHLIFVPELRIIEARQRRNTGAVPFSLRCARRAN